MKYLLGIILSCGLFSPVYAELYYCPTTSKFIDIGFSMQQIETLCGKPTIINAEDTNENVEITRWIYNKARLRPSQNISSALSIDFVKNKVIEVTTQYTGGDQFANVYCFTLPRKGDTHSQVMGSCGKPDQISQITPDKTVDKDERVIWQYQRDPYSSKMLIYFLNGQVVSIEIKG